MELKVINEITEEVKNFKSIEEFNLYYQKHKDEMNEQTTQYLNRVYKIVTPEGTTYRITKKNCSKNGTRRIGGDIFLKKVVNVTDLRELDLQNKAQALACENDVIKADIESLKNDFSRISSQNNDFKQSFQASIDAFTQKYELKFTAIDKKLAELTNTVNQIAKYINEQISSI